MQCGVLFTPLTGRLSPDTPANKILQTDENSNVLIYMTGHGGDEFFKFHDMQEISSQDMSYLFREMHAKKRYKEILLVVDTCQASTCNSHVDVPDVYTLTSSLRGRIATLTRLTLISPWPSPTASRTQWSNISTKRGEMKEKERRRGT